MQLNSADHFILIRLYTRSTAVCNGGSLLPRSILVSNYKFPFKLAALLTLLVNVASACFAVEKLEMDSFVPDELT